MTGACNKSQNNNKQMKNYLNYETHKNNGKPYFAINYKLKFQRTTFNRAIVNCMLRILFCVCVCVFFLSFQLRTISAFASVRISGELEFQHFNLIRANHSNIDFMDYKMGLLFKSPPLKEKTSFGCKFEPIEMSNVLIFTAKVCLFVCFVWSSGWWQKLLH